MPRPIPVDPLDRTLDQDAPLVRTLARAKPATKAERTFQELVAKLATKREALKLWQDYEQRYNKRVVDEIEPLRVQLQAHQRRLVALIDDQLSRPADSRRFGRTQRAKLSNLLLDLVAGLLEESDDDALVALHDKYSDVSREEKRKSEMELAQSLLNDVFGLDVGDDHGATTTEELLEHARRKAEESAAMDERAAGDRRGGRDGPDADHDDAKPSAAQGRREQAAKEVSQSLRDIYRKLASALHPDREQDPDARRRKTLLMQRVNQAYDGGDLLTLLGLQLEIEQIDAAYLSSVPAKRLAHYNKVLREQLADLEAELAHHIEPFLYRTGVLSGAMLTPVMVDQHLSSSVKQLKLAIRQIREDLVAFRDPAVLRQMLDHYELVPDIADPHEAEDLARRFAQDLAPAARGKPRRRR